MSRKNPITPAHIHQKLLAANSTGITTADLLQSLQAAHPNLYSSTSRTTLHNTLTRWWKRSIEIPGLSRTASIPYRWYISEPTAPKPATLTLEETLTVVNVCLSNPGVDHELFLNIKYWLTQFQSLSLLFNKEN